MSPNLLGTGEIQDWSFLTCPLMLGNIYLQWSQSPLPCTLSEQTTLDQQIMMRPLKGKVLGKGTLEGQESSHVTSGFQKLAREPSTQIPGSLHRLHLAQTLPFTWNQRGAVYWEQLCQTGTIATGRTRRLLVKPPRGGDACVIVLIKGKPGVIVGLDENGFVAARSFRKKETDIFVMSEAAFKVFASA